MKNTPLVLVSSVCLLVFGCAGGSGINARIEEKSAVFGQLTPAAQKDIREGTIEPGYTADMVYMALGKPTKVVVKDSARGKIGIWEFQNFYPESYDTEPTSAAPARSESVSTSSSTESREVNGKFATTSTSSTQRVKAPAAGANARDRDERVPVSSAFTKVGSSNYGNLNASEEPDVSYLALDRRGANPGTPTVGSFSGRSGAMDYIDIPEMDSATLYVIFFEGRVVQMKLGKQ